MMDELLPIPEYKEYASILENVKYTDLKILSELKIKYENYYVNLKDTKATGIKVQCDDKLNTIDILNKNRAMLKVEYIENRVNYKMFLKFKLLAKIQKEEEIKEIEVDRI